MSRVLRRPALGWGARVWRRQVIDSLALASLVVASWFSLNCLVGAVDLLSH